MGCRIKSGNDAGERAADARIWSPGATLLITIRRANDCFFCCLRHTARQYLEVALEYCHEGHHCGRGRRRPGDGADAARARDRLRGFRAGGRGPRARRRHQHAAARDQGAGRARPARPARCGRDPHLRAVLHQPARPGDLARAARPRRRLRHPAILDPSRTAAGRDLPGGAGAARRVAHSSQLPAAIVHPGRRRRDRVFLRPARIAPAYRARRCADRRRRHPLAGARKALSRRGPAALERPHALARRDRLAGIPHRALDGRGRRSRRQARRSTRLPRVRAQTKG